MLDMYVAFFLKRGEGVACLNAHALKSDLEGLQLEGRDGKDRIGGDYGVEEI
jgi:hypothetical protein